MDTLNYNKECYSQPCPKVDCKQKKGCCFGLSLVSIPSALGDDSKGSKVAPKNGNYCNALVTYEANGNVYLYSYEGVPVKVNLKTNDDTPDIPTKTSDLINDSGFITRTVDNLANYYLKSQTYTKAEVNNLIGQIQTVSIQVVQALPSVGQPNIIYLVPSTSASQANVYDEYIYTNNAWEKIGNTDIDLSGYVTTSDLETALTSKQDTLISGTNIKTINSQSLLGSGDITIQGGESTDVRINGTSITSGGVADIKTQGTYNATSNKIATVSDLPDISTKQDTLVSGTNIKTINNQSILGSGNLSISGTGNVEDVYWDDASTLDVNHIAQLYSEVAVGSIAPDKRQKIWIDTSASDIALSDLASDSTHRVVTDTQIATWSSKQDALVSGTNIKTINSQSLLGSGNINISGGSSAAYELTSADYNWNSTAGSATEPYDSVALWLLDPGLYYTKTVNVYLDSDPGDLLSLDETALLSMPQDLGFLGKGQTITIINGAASTSAYPVYKLNPTTGARTELTQIPFGTLPTVVDNLNSISFIAALSANQGRVLKEMIEGRVITGAGAPTTSTVGTVGMLYEDTTNGKLYQCTAIDTTDPQNPSYTWTDTRSYDNLSDRPKINNITITGNKTPQMYGLQPAGDYASNTTITSVTQTTFSREPANNTEYRCTNDMTTITYTMPASPANNYITWLVFPSGSTATSFNYPNTILWTGDDVSNNVFTPVADKTYNCAIWWDGINFNGVARGV